MLACPDRRRAGAARSRRAAAGRIPPGLGSGALPGQVSEPVRHPRPPGHRCLSPSLPGRRFYSQAAAVTPEPSAPRVVNIHVSSGPGRCSYDKPVIRMGGEPHVCTWPETPAARGRHDPEPVLSLFRPGRADRARASGWPARPVRRRIRAVMGCQEFLQSKESKKHRRPRKHLEKVNDSEISSCKLKVRFLTLVAGLRTCPVPRSSTGLAYRTGDERNDLGTPAEHRASDL
jgi:hypothetical protein